jgi:hypothetical protein
MNFFCTKKHYDEWLQGAGGNPDIFGMPVADAVVVSRILFEPPEDRS